MSQSPISKLAAEISACRICVENPAGKILPHEPRPVVVMSATAKICICGQAPGTRVHESGIPFDDRSGDRLRDWMAVSREQFYDASKLAIVPMGFCFPGLDAKGGDLPPRKECRTQWHERVMALMPQIELVLVIGMYARDYHLPQHKRSSVTDLVKDWRNVMAERTAPVFLPMPHPSWRNTGWLKKNPWFEQELLPVLRQKTKAMM